VVIRLVVSRTASLHRFPEKGGAETRFRVVPPGNAEEA
jgi:hypothetical protein